MNKKMVTTLKNKKIKNLYDFVQKYRFDKVKKTLEEIIKDDNFYKNMDNNKLFSDNVYLLVIFFQNRAEKMVEESNGIKGIRFKRAFTETVGEKLLKM